MNECKHKYKYIATESVPTDQWRYGERIYKEEIIAYCPLCHTHKRMSRDEWDSYHSLNATLNRRYSDTPVCSFKKEKTAAFEVNDVFINIDLFKNIGETNEF